jgi:N-acetylglutamate synthase and related acetyltransferases
MDCEIRHVRMSDAESIAELSSQLGYPVPLEQIAHRLHLMEGDSKHAVVVVCLPAGSVVAWMDLGIVLHLQSGEYCEIGGLVVADSARNQGIGAKLVAYAERWAAERGMKKVLVRSNAKRADAHRFYLRENYEMVKTSAVFEKRLE